MQKPRHFEGKDRGIMVNKCRVGSGVVREWQDIFVFFYCRKLAKFLYWVVPNLEEVYSSCSS